MGETGFTEGAHDLRGNLVANVAINQSNSATTEPAASHPCAESTSITSRVDGGVQFGAGDLVVVTEGVMGGVHKRSHFADPAGVEELDKLGDAVVLSDDVTNPAGQLFIIESSYSGPQVTDVTQATDAEDAGSIFAGSTSCLVLAVDQPVGGAGVDDKQFQADRI